MDFALTIISYSFGFRRGAEGICTQRLADALSEYGCEPIIVSSTVGADKSSHHKVVRFHDWSARPMKIQRLIGNILLGMPSQHWHWVLRGTWYTPIHGIIYSRCIPLASLVLGYRLAIRYSLPLVSHFSDPLPSPWSNNSSRASKLVLKCVKEIVDYSALLTFTTDEARDYMANIYGQDILNRSIVVRNIAPEWKTNHNFSKKQNVDIVHLGSFYEQRTPLPLIQGTALANELTKSHKFRLHFVGASSRTRGEVGKIVPSKVEILWTERTSDVIHYYENAFIVAVIDADVKPYVFLATKTTEAVHSAQRVLIITSEKSPASRFFGNRWQSVQVVPHNPVLISHAILRLANVSVGVLQNELPYRRKALQAFRSEFVAQNLLESLRTIPIRKQ